MLYKNRVSTSLMMTLLCLFSLLTAFPSGADAAEVATYTAPDGFKVVSYSQNWATQEKLKGVYNELLQNAHGEEFRLLTRINIYPGADSQNSSTAGRWYGQWQIKNGVPALVGNRYIDIYNGDMLTTVSSIARTLSHEYGHHFTYYYFYKKEKKDWDSWRSTQFATARGLKDNSKAGSSSVEHKWLIQEIAAEDYVQLFGSPYAKSSVLFKDITDRIDEAGGGFSYSTDIFNLQPQENTEIPLANNMSQLKNYWLAASGIKDKWGKAPTKPVLKLNKINKIEQAPNLQYVFNWSKSTDDRTANLEYTLISIMKMGNTLQSVPIRTVYSNSSLTGSIGAAEKMNSYTWEAVPSGIAYYVVYVKDGDGQVTASDLLAVDFTDKTNPDSVLVDDNSRKSVNWFKPRVKVNDVQLSFDVQPENLGGRLLVPLRGIFEALGAQVSWNAPAKTITAQKGGSQISMQVNNAQAYVNGKVIGLDQAPTIKNGRTLVPLRFISEALGADVAWNQNLMLANITGH